nr:VacJ family lipoprotein [Myxococcota bacterium]
EDDDWLDDPVDVSDPIEPVNRGIFWGNRWLDRLLLEPLARGYGWILPDFAKRSVRGVFRNLREPVVFVNDLLQLEGRRAGRAGARFLINTTVGIAGLWDPATRWGIEHHNSDFGQTLGRAGIPPGPYLVIPVLGPSSARDAVGSVVDLLLSLDTWFLPLGSQLVFRGTSGITERESRLEEVKALEDSALDFYSALRTAWWLDRQAFVEGSD